MNRNIKQYFGVVFTLSIILFGSDAFASGVGTITYGYAPQSIPALSGSMLVVLALLFAVVTFRVLRTQAGGKPLAVFVTAGILALVATSGNQFIKSSIATNAFSFIPGLNPASITIPGYGLQQGQNQTGQPIKIISVNSFGN